MIQYFDQIRVRESILLSKIDIFTTFSYFSL